MAMAALAAAGSAEAGVTKAPFGKTADGKPVELFTLSGKDGFEAKISTYGATLVSLKAPDKKGVYGDVVLGFTSVDPYVKGVPFYGATIGRYGNRIALGKFTLDGKSYQLPTNDGPNSLHGGTKGFDKRLWTAEPVDTKDGSALKLTYVSADGEEGYPGQLTVHVTYTLKANHTLAITYDATTTKPTVVNLTNHTYFNLSGNPEKPILNHLLTLKADRFTPVNKTLIPTGELKPVKGTPFDFTKATVIGARIEANDEQLKFGKGYDHNWVLNSSGKLASAAVLEDPESGRVLEVSTTEPGIQFYSGNFMDGKPAGAGTVYKHRTGLCLETQHFPDSPNHPSFPSTVLKPGQAYHSETVLSFRTK
ncbi:galactose mutarotase [Rhizomicrobium palustre]